MAVVVYPPGGRGGAWFVVLLLVVVALVVVVLVLVVVAVVVVVVVIVVVVVVGGGGGGGGGGGAAAAVAPELETDALGTVHSPVKHYKVATVSAANHESLQDFKRTKLPRGKNAVFSIDHIKRAWWYCTGRMPQNTRRRVCLIGVASKHPEAPHLIHV